MRQEFYRKEMDGVGTGGHQIITFFALTLLAMPF
jgi:hypothetical protein